MKIWVVGRNYPGRNNNFQGSFELEQAKMLAKSGNDVTYISCVLHPFWRIRNGGYVTFDDERVIVCAYSGFYTPHMTDPLIQFPYFPKIRNKKWEGLLKKAENITGLPDVIHIHFPLMILSAEVFEKFHDRGVKIIVTEHWTKVINKRLDVYEKSQMMSYLRFADAYMCVGYSLRKAICEISETDREIIVMPNIVNDVFRLKDRPNEGFTFGIVGRLVSEKQMDKVIEAFAENFKNMKDIRLVIVGNGKEFKNLVSLAISLEIKDQVDFRGALSRIATAEAVQKLDCLVCFSSYETFGVPVIEAWACGVPVITTTADCITDRWDDRLGISVSCTSKSDLSKAMRYMVENRNSYNSKFISEYALSRYSEESIYDRLISIYKS